MADFPAENIQDWRDMDVVDRSGDKVGSLESVYYDTASDAATFAAVVTGLLGRRRLVFVPLLGAVVAPKYLKVQYDKKLIKDAPSIDTDGQLASETEPAIFAHYDLPYVVGSNGERRLGRR